MLRQPVRLAFPVLACVVGFATRSTPTAHIFDAKSLNGAMRWRSNGPHRGGRTKAIAGVPGQPNVFFMAPANGGVWKTDDFGCP